MEQKKIDKLYELLAKLEDEKDNEMIASLKWAIFELESIYCHEEVLVENETEKGFTAEKCNFQGISGYMVKQYIDGKQVVEQFISESSYNDFCEVVGITPKLI